jgi:hypothetical protein
MFLDFTGRPIDSLAWGMMIFYGGLLQLIVGFIESKKGNTFGTVAFASYGSFWMSFAFMNIAVALGLAAPDHVFKAVFFFGWGFLTFMLFFGTLKTNRALQSVFGLLTIVFVGLGAGTLLQSNDVIVVSAAIGIVLGLVAMYTGLAEVINEVNKKEVLPLFPVSK